MFIVTCFGRKTFHFSILAVSLFFLVAAVRVFAAPPIDLSSVNQYNQLSFGNANLVNSYVQGNVAYGGNATFDQVSLATSSYIAPCPTGNTVVEVAGSVNYLVGTIFGGSGRYGTTLSSGSQIFGCHLDSWVQGASTLNFTALQSQLTTLANQLTSAVVTGPFKVRDCYISATRTNSDLNVYNVDGAIFENIDTNRHCTFAIEAPCSSTVLINVSGTNLNLTNFDLTLGSGGLSSSQVLVNFYEAQTINLNNVQIAGTVLAPLATVTGAVSSSKYNRIVGGLFVDELNGQFNSEAAPFVAGPQSGCELTYDFGDLPNSYSVKLLENGARHEIGNLYLGNTVDAEADGQPSPSAEGDTVGDDGIVTNPESWSSNVPNGGLLSTVASGLGCLNGWIDWNQDGDFDDANEQIVDNQPVSTAGAIINFQVQYVASGQTRFARFRITEQTDVNGQMVCVDNIAPTGLYKNGEVEDYLYVFADATAVTLQSAETPPPSIPVLLLLALMLGMATWVVRRRA
jgi:choice-of-anchor A domain-containing protein